MSITNWTFSRQISYNSNMQEEITNKPVQAEQKLYIAPTSLIRGEPFVLALGQHYQPRHYVVPGDYPSAAALLAACAVTPDPASEVRLSRLRPGEEDGEA